MKLKKLHIVFLNMLWLTSFIIAQEKGSGATYSLLTKETEFVVGSDIILKFSCQETSKRPQLYISNSYGSTLLSAHWDSFVLYYTIPFNFSAKAGNVSWELVDDGTSKLKGNFTLTPQQKVSTMETYVGPPSIDAGEVDYSMLVVIPTDAHDNPVANNTLVQTTYQFLQNEVTNGLYTNNLIAYQNIYAPQKSGRMLIASECLGTNSDEFTVNVMPAIPTNFKIFSERPHSYADANQITTLYTSVIKDAYSNVVADGTFVSFVITTIEGNVLKTSGTTINGVANAKMIHPDHKDQWSIKAFVTGMAESNTINITYEQALKDFEVAFTNQNRNFTVGPLQSFMQQMIPDGLQVKVSVYTNGKLVDTMLKTSRKGYVDFYLKNDLFSNETYTLKIETAGIVKTFKKKLL